MELFYKLAIAVLLLILHVQHYVIMFVSALRHVRGFLWVLWFPQPIKLTAMILWLKVALNTVNQTLILHDILLQHNKVRL